MDVTRVRNFDDEGIRKFPWGAKFAQKSAFSGIRQIFVWYCLTLEICIASRKTGPSSPGPVHYNTGPADIIQNYGTGPVYSVQLDLNCTVRQIMRS